MALAAIVGLTRLDAAMAVVLPAMGIVRVGLLVCILPALWSMTLPWRRLVGRGEHLGATTHAFIAGAMPLAAAVLFIISAPEAALGLRAALVVIALASMTAAAGSFAFENYRRA